MPQKPYAFVCYDSESEAMKAYRILNGTDIAPSAGDRNNPVTLYISYVGEGKLIRDSFNLLFKFLVIVLLLLSNSDISYI